MKIGFPEKLKFLLDGKQRDGKVARYIVLFGGRGGLKTWSVAQSLLIRAARTRLRILCARELMNSIDESVHFTLSSQIARLGLQDKYDVARGRITCRTTGSEFLYKGLRHNVQEIKSLEDIDICWVEEAKNVSKSSWDVLIPTIRKDNSQFIITFNPELEQDVTYQRFVAHPPSNAIVLKTGYEDNPWLSEAFVQEMADCRSRNEEDFINIYGGYPKQVVDGAIYANELRAAIADGRITKVAYDHRFPVNTYWDLGRADMTAIWFAQKVGLQWRMLSYYQNHGHGLQHYLKYIQDQDYVYGEHWMPHDANALHLGSTNTIKAQAEAAIKKVRIVRRSSVVNGINALRTIFPMMYFDADKCADGIQCLRHYHYEVDADTGQRSANPEHDEYSHGSDSARYFAQSITEGAEDDKPKYKEPPSRRYEHRQGWMNT